MKWMSKCDLFAITLPKKLQEGGAPPPPPRKECCGPGSVTKLLHD